MVMDGRTEDVRQLLESNECLFENTIQSLHSSQKMLDTLSAAATILSRIRDSLQMAPTIRLSTIWIRAASADLIGSPLLRETMLLVKKIPSDKFLQLLNSLMDLDLPLDLEKYQCELRELIKLNTDSAPLRSQHDVRNESLRTTVVAQKVLLSKHKATLSEQDKAYSELVCRFHDEMETYFSTSFIDPQALFLSELLMYDLKTPHTEVFQPRPRFAIERALASPHDYLGCDCCGEEGDAGGEATLSATQPATAVLYQLYLESGALINVSDLWAAFKTMVGDDGEDSESRTM